MAFRLRHIHLPSAPGRGIFPTYASASALQELLRRQFLDAKDNGTISQLQPAVISFTPQPTFTLGRRQAEAALSSAELARLKAPLRITSPNGQHVFEPAVLASPRGGLTTYHGPGQVVLWPVLDLKSPRHRQFSVRCYSRLLETTTIAVLARLWGLRAFTTEDPGVWVRSVFSGAEAQEEEEQETRKIAALGVHLRRHVSALGTAINLSMPTTRGVVSPVPSDGSATSAPVTDEDGGHAGQESDEESTNPWARFVACGLAGKGVTCAAAETQAALKDGRGAGGGAGRGAAVGGVVESGSGTAGLNAGTVASAWAAELARALGVEGVDEIDEAGVESLLAKAKDQGAAGYVASAEEAL